MAGALAYGKGGGEDGWRLRKDGSRIRGSGEITPIVENCGNTLILRCSSSEGGCTSRFASRLIGERELVRRQISKGHTSGSLISGAAARSSTNITEHHVTELAVMPSELEQLPDLAGYLKLASSPAWLNLTMGMA